MILVFIGIMYVFKDYNSVEALSRYGSTGSEVRQIQTKLKNWGYYNGSVDGIYGSKTLTATKNYQRKAGLSNDGIVGCKTWRSLVE